MSAQSSRQRIDGIGLKSYPDATRLSYVSLRDYVDGISDGSELSLDTRKNMVLVPAGYYILLSSTHPSISCSSET